MAQQEFKDMGRRPPAVDVEQDPAGQWLLSCPYPPGALPVSVIDVFRKRADLHPDRLWLARRNDAGQWLGPTYGETYENCRRFCQALLNAGLGQSDCVAILSPRSFAHFVVSYGAMMAGVPVAPLSAPYSLLSQDHARLKYIVGLLQPIYLMVDDWASYEPAISSLQDANLLAGAKVIVAEGDVPQLDWIVSLDSLMETSAGNQVNKSIAALTHETRAKYMFTSGSTGMPKAVIYTQGMMCHCLAGPAGLQRTPQDNADQADLPDGSRVLEWMPWSHTGAGVMRLNSVLASGGTIYFDTGRPVPGEYEETIRNLAEVKPTVLSGAPVGYSMLADALERDDALNRTVFSNVNSLAFGSAAMSPALYDRIQALAIQATGQKIGITSGLASTEVIGCCSVYWPMEGTGTIGLPQPGVQLKLVPNGDKLELRVKGGTVTQGYFKDEEKTRLSFDDEGYFMMGDAVRFVDPDDPVKGLVFDGRVAEEFKLATGTWVSAGTLRTKVVSALSPFVRDCVVCGLNESFVSVMLWLNVPACRELVDERLNDEQMADSPAILQNLAERLNTYNMDNPGSSTRIARFLVLPTPPTLDSGELTEKGYVNQRTSLQVRSEYVARLYTDNPAGPVVVLD